MQQEVLTSMKSDNFIFPVADGTVRIPLEEIEDLRTIHLDPGNVQNEERNKKFFEENQTDSILQTLFKMTQHGMMRKLKMTSGLLREISFVAITWNPESNCTCRKKNHFLIPLKYIDVTRTTHTSLDVLLEKHVDDYWNVDGERELSVDRASQDFILLNESPPEGYTWSSERLTRKQTTSRPDKVWPDMWKHMSDAAKSKAKQKWAVKKPKLDKCQTITWVSSSLNQMMKNLNTP